MNIVEGRPQAVRVRSGVIRRVRHAEPRTDGRLRLHVTSSAVPSDAKNAPELDSEEEVIIHADLHDESNVGVLDDFARHGTQVKLGVLVMPGGVEVLHWALAEDGRRFSLRCTRERIAGTLKLFAWVSLLSAALVSGVWASGSTANPGTVISGLSAILTAFSILSLLVNAALVRGLAFELLQHRALAELECRLAKLSAQTPQVRMSRADARPRGASPSGGDGRPQVVKHAREKRRPQETFCLLSGTLTNIHLSSRTYRTELAGTFRVYCLVIGGDQVELHLPSSGPLPFLAVGDQLDVVVRWFTDRSESQDSDGLVYALRSTADHEVYVVHRMFQLSGFKHPMTRLGPRSIREFLCWFGWSGVLISSAMAMGSIWLEPDSYREASTWMYSVSPLLLCVVLPRLLIFYLTHRWRAGRPTLRQQTVEAVYAALNLPHPLAAEATDVIDV